MRVPGRWIVIGTGPEEQSLRALAIDLGVADRVIWLGEVERPEPRPIAITAGQGSVEDDIGVQATCYRLVAFNGQQPLGGSDVLCGVPGVTSFGPGGGGGGGGGGASRGVGAAAHPAGRRPAQP